MKLYFRNHKNNLRIIAEPTSYNGACNEIKQFLEAHNFESHHINTWTDPDTGRIIMNVGSHVEFFELDCSEEERESVCSIT